MNDSEHNLKMLLRIRSIRVKKQIAVLKASEQHLNSKLNERNELTLRIQSHQETYQRQQREQTQKLLNRESQIIDFLALKSNEKTFFWNNKKMTREGDALVDQIQESRLSYQNEQTKLKAVEKAVIKVEEFLKLDWE